jgi:hypothetical protein
MFVANAFPRFAISDAEAMKLAEAVCNYLRHTKLKVDPKTRDLYALIMCLAMVEGTRLIATVNDMRNAKAAKAATASGEFGTIAPAGVQDNVYAMPMSR